MHTNKLAERSLRNVQLNQKRQQKPPLKGNQISEEVIYSQLEVGTASYKYQ